MFTRSNRLMTWDGLKAHYTRLKDGDTITFIRNSSTVRFLRGSECLFRGRKGAASRYRDDKWSFDYKDFKHTFELVSIIADLCNLGYSLVEETEETITFVFLKKPRI